MVTPSMVTYLSKPKDYLEPLDIAASEVPSMLPGMLTPVWCGFSVFCTILGLSRRQVPERRARRTGRNIWDVKKFPGRRGLYKGVSGMLELALDGGRRAGGQALPAGRRPRLQDRSTSIKPAVKVWWTSGAQNTQILQSGEVDLSDTWGGRAYAALEGGAPDENGVRRGCTPPTAGPFRRARRAPTWRASSSASA